MIFVSDQEGKRGVIPGNTPALLENMFTGGPDGGPATPGGPIPGALIGALGKPVGGGGGGLL